MAFILTDRDLSVIIFVYLQRALIQISIVVLLLFHCGRGLQFTGFDITCLSVRHRIFVCSLAVNIFCSVNQLVYRSCVSASYRMTYSHQSSRRLSNSKVPLVANRKNSFEIVASHVNRHWRDVAIHLSSLWCKIDIVPLQSIDLLQMYLVRSQP